MQEQNVVVWCRNQKIYNCCKETDELIELWFDVGIKRYTTERVVLYAAKPLWFDVGIKRYTTFSAFKFRIARLWFDVGIKRYTTLYFLITRLGTLWFDVGIKRYTTFMQEYVSKYRCGLM